MEKEKERLFPARCVLNTREQGGHGCPQPGLGLLECSGPRPHPLCLRHPAHLPPRGQAAEAVNLQG